MFKYDAWVHKFRYIIFCATRMAFKNYRFISRLVVEKMGVRK